MLDNNYFRRWFLIIFALFCVGINVTAYVLYEKNEVIATSKQWVSHTYEVITEGYKLFTAIQDRQSAHRAYMITSNQQYLKSYETFNDVISDSFSRLTKLTKDNEEQEVRLTEYTKALEDLNATLAKQIRSKEIQSGIDVFDISETKPRIDNVRFIHNELIESEMKLLEKRKTEEERLQKNFIWTLFLAAGLSAVGLLIANIFVAFLTYRRKFVEEDLLRTNKEMEGFTYIASHDLRSPLVNLKGFATEMKYSVDELRPIIENNADNLSATDGKKALDIIDHEIPDALRYIHSSVEKMDKLTNAILELSRIGRRNISFANVETERVVRHILDTLHHTISSNNIKVSLGPLPDVVADQMSVEQVFANIIDNAIKYLDPSRQGQIEIGGIRMYRDTKFWVKDNGRGIDNSDYQKIFEIYRRAGNTENIPGEGMGMAYVRTTLRRLGGQIWCESTPGLGTTFYFTISNSLKKDKSK
ncbi:MAG: hypothetical protein DI586_00905 [Micavibrio aeruginosavorus]|uniref:histidine kinase n=1 Tax=Micavibrio aeruginosavorus TaxID=349221 RepID=A0A2W5FU18_9BACT|nr:MAG: hypothetical protein DI586_00905 [Micavibrio aeruginosavorus]